MKSASVVTILSVLALNLIAATSASAVVREGGGIGNIHILYQCTEVKPTNPADPMVASIDQVMGAVILSVHKQSAYAPNFDYQNKVELNKAVRCMVACELYENKQDSVHFSITNLGKFNSANFQYPRGTLNFNCERGAY